MDAINTKELHKRRTRLEKSLLEAQNNIQTQRQILNLHVTEAKHLDEQLKAVNRVIRYLSHAEPMQDQPPIPPE